MTASEPKTYMGWNVDFLHPTGEPAFLAPDSLSWQILKNPVSKGIGGVCAVLLEFADPRIRSGVWDHSTFRIDPVGRSIRTHLAAMVGAYGPRSAARRVIRGVGAMHARVRGETPDGRPYRALDPDLLDWVGATASYGFLMAYDRFVSPLSDADKCRFLAEGADVGQLYGVTRRPSSPQEFDAMLDELLPGFEPHPIVTDFLDTVRSVSAAPRMPRWLQRDLVHAAVALLPDRVRERLELGAGYELGRRGELLVRGVAGLADRIPDRNGPPAQACERLGLPRDFLWRSPRSRARLLERAASHLASEVG